MKFGQHCMSFVRGLGILVGMFAALGGLIALLLLSARFPIILLPAVVFGTYCLGRRDF